jgi:PilZ domain
VLAETSREHSRPERRRHQRAKIALGGRYMLSDRREHDCWTLDISSSGVAIFGPVKGAIGERIVAYFDRVGRVEGMIVRHFEKCFAIEMRASALKRDKLDLQIDALVKSGIAGH